MNRIVKQSSIFLLSLLLLVCLFPVNAHAEKRTITSAAAISVPNYYISGEVVKGQRSLKYFKLSAGTYGKIEIDISTEYNHEFMFMDANGEILRLSKKTINASNTAHQSLTYFVDPGVYYLGFGASIQAAPYGKYSFKTTWTPAGLTETESNDTLLTADSINLSQIVTGAFAVKTGASNKRDKDFYSIRLSGAGMYQLETSSEAAHNIRIYNASGEQQYYQRVSLNSTLGLATFSKSIRFTAGGQYYIMIEPVQDSFCSYSLKLGASNFKPDKPSGFTIASSGATSVKLSWNSVKDADGYTLYAKSGKSKWKEIGNVTKNKCTIKKLKAGSTYAFRIRAFVTTNGVKKYSLLSDKQTIAIAPAATSITGITRTAPRQSGLGYYYRANLSWKKVSGATEYRIYVKRPGSTTKSYVGTTKKNSTIVSTYWSKYSKGSLKYTYYVVPVKKYHEHYYYGKYSKGVTYTFS